MAHNETGAAQHAYEIAALAPQCDIDHAAITKLLSQAAELMEEYKPNDRSDADRCIAIALTDLEKVRVWWKSTCWKDDTHD